MSDTKENSDTFSTPTPEGRAEEGLGNKAARSVANVVSGSFLSQESTLKNFPFIFYLSLLAICYIAYGYYSDDQVRKVNQLTSQIKELRTQYIVTKDSLVIKSKQTEVAKSLVQTGIKESIVPPKKILVKATTDNSQNGIGN
jgi:hypothetical protein